MLLLWRRGWPLLLILCDSCQHPPVSQVRLECVEDVKLLIWTQGQELLDQLARVRAPGKEGEGSTESQDSTMSRAQLSRGQSQSTPVSSTHRDRTALAQFRTQCCPEPAFTENYI